MYIDKDREVGQEGKVSLFHTSVFFLICLFFTCVALHWELKHRMRFKRRIKLKELSAEEIRTTLADFEHLKTCQDPIVEHFVEKHPMFTDINRLWLINSCTYWLKRYRREANRRRKGQ